MSEEATARVAMEKSKYDRAIEGKEVRGDGLIKHFLPQESQVPFQFHGG